MGFLHSIIVLWPYIKARFELFTLQIGTIFLISAATRHIVNIYLTERYFHDWPDSILILFPVTMMAMPIFLKIFFELCFPDWLDLIFAFVLGVFLLFHVARVCSGFLEFLLRLDVVSYKNPDLILREADEKMSVERKYETRFESIIFYRQELTAFPIEMALQDYHREPIVYALALAELSTEVYEATWTRSRGAIMLFTNALSRKRRNRDVLGDEIYNASVNGLTFLQIIRFWKTLFLQSRFGGTFSKKITVDVFDTSILAWKLQFENFAKNINLFCQQTGSEVDDLAPPQETINNLRKFAADRRQELAPLLEVNARLNKELTSYKRINAALQTRHTIEKLTFELPDTKQYYDLVGSGPKWQKLWDQIWTDASGNVNNPFHTLWNQSTGQYARDNIRDKGRNLFADMSGEIHGYDQRPRNSFDYEHFDASARKVATILHENPVVDPQTGDVDWTKEIRKYPIAWPAADNLALTKLERLEGQVVNCQRRLNNAVKERDEHQAKIQAQKEPDEEKLRERLENKKANDNAQNDLENVMVGDLFDDSVPPQT